MTSEAKPRIKVTYATLRADNEELHAGFEEAATRVRGELGAQHQNYVDGARRDGVSTFEARSPIDTDICSGRSRPGRRPISTMPWPPRGARSPPGPRRPGESA
jgi:hypothetical protein